MTPLRTYGRIVPNPLFPDQKQWVVVTTDARGFNDDVWLTTLIQVIKLNLGESPFYSNYGIPAHPSVVMQIAPDFYMTRTQQQFAQYFLSLMISKGPDAPDELGIPSPSYNVRVVFQWGSTLSTNVPY
jgi:hypothetical protein